MAESGVSSCSDSNDNRILSVSVNYSSDDDDDSDDSMDLSLLAEFGVLLYCFKPEASDSESSGHSEGDSSCEPDILSQERVGNTD